MICADGSSNVGRIMPVASQSTKFCCPCNLTGVTHTAQGVRVVSLGLGICMASFELPIKGVEPNISVWKGPSIFISMLCVVES